MKLQFNPHKVTATRST